MKFKELFMSYDQWFKHHNIATNRYDDELVHLLYNDRWMMIIMPVMIIVVGIVIAIEVFKAVKP